MTKLRQLFRGWMIRLGSAEDSVVGVLLSLAGDSAQYLVGLVVMGLANMVLLPLYTRYLSPADFGLYALI
jgi:hypothetical protein